MRFIIALLLLTTSVYSQQPFRIAIDGLSHSHVHWLLNRAKDGDLEIVGIAEKNTDLANRYLKQYNLSPALLYPSLDALLQKVKPEAVAAFNSIFDHLSTVRSCAPKGIHVMVEKPLAVSVAHAKEMEALASHHKIHLLTNYETTWYGSNYRAFNMIDSLGGIRKLVIHDGHPGPKEIGVNKEFLEWLTDPVLNGGGAVMDFGCYGANLSTWLMGGQRPLSVTAITQQIKPDVYPKVDDEATIVLVYPSSQTIIQASWNWPYNRKDMEVYGKLGYVVADRQGIRARPTEKSPETSTAVPVRPAPYDDPFRYLAAVVRGEVTLRPYDLSALPNNVLVVEILEAAKESAKTGKRVAMSRRGN